ncbi:MAG: hypothetical protein R2769_14420, partial [Saprospiraceae bacterium]
MRKGNFTQKVFTLMNLVFPILLWGILTQTNAQEPQLFPKQKENSIINLAPNSMGDPGFCNVGPHPGVRDIDQPDGSIIHFYIYKHYNIMYLETKDGYTFMKDPSDGYHKFVVQGPDGDLLLTNLVVKDEEDRNSVEQIALNVIPKHLRYQGEVYDQKKQEYQDLRKATGKSAAAGPQAVFPPSGNRKALLLLI